MSGGSIVLLDSTAYGERWAAVWLDLARYADSKGYEKDGFRDMWRYRDWVIDAFNNDLPYNRFLTEQLAGDLLPNPTEDQLVATAFHRNTPENDEGGTDDEEFRTYAVIDRVNTTFDALQGTTVGCVQCHGHPYDPFVHREYYQLMAFFNNTADTDKDDDPRKRFHARSEAKQATELEQRIAERQKQIDNELARPEVREEFRRWLEEVRPPENYTPLRDLTVTSTEGNYQAQEDGRVLLKGSAPQRTTVTVEATAAGGPCRALVISMLPDDALPKRGPGGNDQGNFILTRFHATLLSTNTTTTEASGSEPAGSNAPPTVSRISLSFTNARATFEQGGWPVADAITSGPGKKKEGEGGWAIAGGTGKGQTAIFFLTEPVEFAEGARLRITLECENKQWTEHVLGCFRLATSRALVAPKLEGLTKEVRTILDKEPAGWSKEERSKAERSFFAGLNKESEELDRGLEEDRKALAALPVCDLPIMQELTGKQSRVTKIFHRGNWMDKSDTVEAMTPQVLNRWPEDYPKNRLGFAKWLTNGENPLTARVHVNRIWEQLFGLGLVETLEDFGTQGDKPLYQELLDELAARFQTDLQWSQKKLIREIVLSRVYRQSSKTTRVLVERDPENRWLARGPRFRLNSEQLRDQALAVAGALEPKMFGPPVMPYQPPGMWLTPYEGRDWTTSKGTDSRRRALYTFIRRSATYPSFVTFDAPNREYCVVRRIRTNTPLQSLDLLNNPVFFEAAEGLAKRMETEGGTELESQLKRGLFLALQRPPRSDEVEVLKQLNARVEGNLKLVANAILNLDEVLNRN